MASCLPKLADTIWLFLANLWLCQLQKIFQLYSSLLWHTICTVPFWEKFPKISGKRQILRSLESFLLLDHPETRPFYATLGMTKLLLKKLWFFSHFFTKITNTSKFSWNWLFVLISKISYERDRVWMRLWAKISTKLRMSGHMITCEGPYFQAVCWKLRTLASDHVTTNSQFVENSV